MGVTSKNRQGDIESLELNNFSPGYSRYAALLSADPSYHIFRRFTRARQRLLLLKQDEICQLEECLDEIDKKDTNHVFLGCRRIDANEARQENIQKLSRAMSEYDALFKHSYTACSLQQAATRNVDSLKNWTKAKGTIGRAETAYLDKREDLVSLVGCEDETMERIEWLLEDLLIWFHNNVRMRLCGSAKRQKRLVTADEQVHFFGPRVKNASRALMAWLTTLILLVPIIVLNSLSTMVGRFVTIIVAAGIFVFAVSFITKAKTSEVFLSGAAYAAVLVVFTSNNNGLAACKGTGLSP